MLKKKDRKKETDKPSKKKKKGNWDKKNELKETRI